MTDNEQGRSIDTDIMIGNLLHQAEAAVVIDEESLARRKHELLGWTSETDDTASAPAPSQPDESRESPRTAGRPHRGADDPDRPLNEAVFLTVAEVASVMRVSKMTVYRLVSSGHLPAIRVGRSFRVPEQAVHEYLRIQYVDIEHTEPIDRP